MAVIWLTWREDRAQWQQSIPLDRLYSCIFAKYNFTSVNGVVQCVNSPHGWDTDQGKGKSGNDSSAMYNSNTQHTQSLLLLLLPLHLLPDSFDDIQYWCEEQVHWYVFWVCDSHVWKDEGSQQQLILVSMGVTTMLLFSWTKLYMYLLHYMLTITRWTCSAQCWHPIWLTRIQNARTCWEGNQSKCASS